MTHYIAPSIKGPFSDESDLPYLVSKEGPTWYKSCLDEYPVVKSIPLLGGDQFTKMIQNKQWEEVLLADDADIQIQPAQ